MRCEEPVKIMEILRLWEQGHSQRAIAASVKCAKSIVGEVQRRCREAGLGYAKASGMTNEAIRERLYSSLKAVQVKAEPEWEELHKRLMANRRLNLRYIWEEYRQLEPSGLGYSQFCRRYHIWRERTGKEVMMVNDTRERVALHQRRRSGSRYVTNIAHMSKKHQYQLEANRRNGASYRGWAETIGANKTPCCGLKRWRKAPIDPVWACSSSGKNMAMTGWRRRVIPPVKWAAPPTPP